MHQDDDNDLHEAKRSQHWKKYMYRERGADLSHSNSNKPGEKCDHNPSPYQTCRPCISQTWPIKRCSSENCHAWKCYSKRLEYTLQNKSSAIQPEEESINI